MSTQSGITASNELLDSFQSSQHDVLIVKISPDSTKLVQDTECPRITGELKGIFPKLNEYIASIHPHPVYILVGVEEKEYAFISYIPDIAHIRDKMLYASTKNTLLQELGGGKIKKDHLFSWSELDELTYEHFQHSRPKTTKEDGPLTEEEKILKDMNSLQDLSLTNDASYSRKLASMNETSSGGQFLFKIDTELEAALSGLDVNDLVIFVIDIKTEQFKLVRKSSVQLSSLVDTLESCIDGSNPAPQFSVYSYVPGKSALIYTCPSASKVKDRMVYASNKQGLVTHLKGLLTLEKVLDIGDPEELEIGELEEKKEQETKENKSGLRFNKPKGPRRR